MPAGQRFAADLPRRLARLGNCLVWPVPPPQAGALAGVLGMALPVIAPAAIGLVYNSPNNTFVVFQHQILVNVIDHSYGNTFQQPEPGC